MKRSKLKYKSLSTVALIFGGMGREHKISVLGADFVLPLLSRRGVRVLPILISEAGDWYTANGLHSASELDEAVRKNALRVKISEKNQPIRVHPAVKDGVGGIEMPCGFVRINCAFPLLHGDLGEDGTAAGMLAALKIKFVGCDAVASAIAADKIAAKMIADALQIPTAPWCFGTGIAEREKTLVTAERELGYPMFIKPARLGSSIGISRVESRDEFLRAYEVAAGLCERVLVEMALPVRAELECGFVSIGERKFFTKIGEIRTRVGFYDYKNKYSTDSDSTLIYPSELDEVYGEPTRRAAERLAAAIGMRGIGRLDFLLTDTGKLYFNEINTTPGFTKSSLYPRLCESVGYTPRRLLHALIRDARGD